jgi:hypothetical protein
MASSVLTWASAVAVRAWLTRAGCLSFSALALVVHVAEQFQALGESFEPFVYGFSLFPILG